MNSPETPQHGATPARIPAAAFRTVAPHAPCCVCPADGKTSTNDLFELKRVADAVYGAIAAP